MTLLNTGVVWLGWGFEVVFAGVDAGDGGKLVNGVVVLAVLAVLVGEVAAEVLLIKILLEGDVLENS